MNVKKLCKACLLVSIVVAPTVLRASSGPVAIGSGRLLPTIAAVIGLIGTIIGSRALARSRGGNQLPGARIALVLGLLSVFVGSLHAANSAGGFGIGNGLAGAMVAISLGLVSAILGSLALYQFGRNRKQ